MALKARVLALARAWDGLAGVARERDAQESALACHCRWPATARISHCSRGAGALYCAGTTEEC